MLVIQVTRNRPRFSRLFLSCNLRHDLLSPNYGAKMQNVKDYKEKFRGRKQWFWKSAKVLSGAELFTIWCKFSPNFHICTGPDPCRHKETKCDKWVMSNHNFSILKNNKFLDSWRPPEILDGWMDGHLKAVDKLWVGGVGLSSRLGWIRRFVLGDLGIKPHLSFQAVKVWLP